jgi:hypothetical protein
MHVTGIVTVPNKLPKPLTKKGKKSISGALIRQQTILTEQPPLVGEISANFSG